MAAEIGLSEDIDYLIRGSLFLVMLGVGLSLTWKEITKIFAYPKGILVGLSIQSLMIPFLAIVAIYYWKMPEYWKIGFIILAACPGGTTTNFITYWFRGNLALSVALTNLNALLSLITIPIITNLAIRIFSGENTMIALPFGDTLLQIFWVTILPAAVGMVIRYYYPLIAAKTESVLKYVTMVFLALVFLLKFFKGGAVSVTFSDFWVLFPPALALNVCGFLLGYFIPAKMGLPVEDRMTIGVELGIHNTTLAFLIGDTLLKNDLLIEPALVYSLFSFWTAAAYAFVLWRYKEKLSLKV